MYDILDRAPCGFLTFTDDGTMVGVNETLRDHLGYGPDELVGQHIQTILTVAGRLFYQTHFFPLLRMRGSAEEIYLALQPKSGPEVPVLINGVRRERDGSVVNDCILVRMHRRNRYEDELLEARKVAEEASNAKAKFLAMLSHDLRTPLQVIVGHAAFLSTAMHGPLNQAQLREVQAIRDSSQEMLRLMNDVLTFASTGSGRITLDVQPVDVRAALDRAEARTRVLMNEAGLVWQRDYCDAVAAFADGDRLQQILLNLITNAIKFTPRGGRIGAACALDDSRVRISVSDTGCGIAADELERIFQPYTQISSSDRSPAVEGGVGLGLSISRELARAMGGDLTVESVPGEGSVFTVSLAAVRSGDEPARGGEMRA